MEGYSFCTSARIVSDINEKKHIYVIFTFSVYLGPKTQNIPSCKYHQIHNSVFLKWRKKEKLHQSQDIIPKKFFFKICIDQKMGIRKCMSVSDVGE